MSILIKNNLPIFMVLALLFSAYILPVLARARRFRLVEVLTILAEGVILLGGVYLARRVLVTGNFNYTVGGWAAPWGIELAVNGLGVLLILTVGAVSLPTAIYAAVDVVQELGNVRRAIWFLTLFLLLTASLIGIALTNDLFNLFVFIEVATISGCALVSSRSQPRSIEAAFKYLMLATLGSGFILIGIGFLFILTGNLNMSYVNQELVAVWYQYPHAVWIALSFFLVGFGVKSALFPLHVWLPDAHSSAITPASALLSGLAVKGYIIGLIKVFYVAIGPELLRSLLINHLLVILGMVAIVAGSLFALAQDELKRRLAFSTIAQVGYIFLGIGMGSTAGLTGALFHILSHALIKSTLFLAAGSVIHQTGCHKISEMAGVGRRMPVTMGVFTLASLAMVGIPLLSGFVGKWQLLLGGLQGGNYLAVAVIIVGSLLSAAYLLSVVRTAFFEPPEVEGEVEAPLGQVIPLIALVAGILLIGIFPGPILRLATQAALGLLGS